MKIAFSTFENIGSFYIPEIFALLTLRPRSLIDIANGKACENDELTISVSHNAPVLLHGNNETNCTFEKLFENVTYNEPFLIHTNGFRSLHNAECHLDRYF